MHPKGEAANSFTNLSTLAGVLLLAYFCYHAISGDRGLLSLVELDNKVQQSRQELDRASAERLRLEHKVSLLRDESLDLDMLDEQARKLLGYVAEDEIIFTNNDK